MMGKKGLIADETLCASAYSDVGVSAWLAWQAGRKVARQA
jgi:hypothetical protein